MNTWKLNVQGAADKREIWTAFLGDAGFSAFAETEENLEAYIETQPENWQTIVAHLTAQIEPEATLSWEMLPAQNWNARWEEHFPPVQVDNFCVIRADFHEPIEGVKHEIRIAPKMAFGTGHHATTYSMMALMENEDFEGKAVLDYGCGTAVLAILACKLGAESLWAIDIDRWAVVNSREHLEMNNCTKIEVAEGDLDVLPAEARFDVCLANINRTVILASWTRLRAHLNKGAKVLASGFLAQDLELVKQTAAAAGWTLERLVQRGDWCAGVWRDVQA